MMKRTALLTSCLLLLTSLLAAAAGRSVAYEPTAEGYPAWAGLTEANYVCGRQICPSDLRHKLTAVILIDAAKFEEQVKLIGCVGAFNPTLSSIHGQAAETFVVPRNNICLIVLVGKIDVEKFNDFLKKNAKDLQPYSWIVYSNVTCSKAPDNAGKFPFYYVFGPEPGDAIASGDFDAAASAKLGQMVQSKKHKIESWKPYYGSVEEPQYMKSFTKILNSGKPLEGLVASCKKGISSKNPDQAKECQILYDALEQTRSDLLFEARGFAGLCPTRAMYEAGTLIKQFPKTKKQLAGALDRIKSIPDIGQLIKMFELLKKWGAEDFLCKNAGEAKKIEAELKKMKKTCDTLVEKSSNNTVQSCAAWIGSEAETLASVISTKVPAK